MSKRNYFDFLKYTRKKLSNLWFNLYTTYPGCFECDRWSLI